MKPYQHAKTSVRKHGGQPADYYAIHNFIDSSKAAVPDMRHRALLHSAFGCWVVEAVFGVVATNSDGATYSPRDVAEDHIIEDLGFIPTVEQWLRNMTLQPWMSGAARADHMRAGRSQAGRVDATQTAVESALRELGIGQIGQKRID